MTKIEMQDLEPANGTFQNLVVGEARDVPSKVDDTPRLLYTVTNPETLKGNENKGRRHGYLWRTRILPDLCSTYTVPPAE